MYLVNLKGLFTEPTSHFKAFLLFDYTWLISSETRLDERTNIANPPAQEILVDGLKMLEQLNLVDNLKNYPGLQLHLFAEQDNVIPCKIIDNFKDFATENMTYKLLKTLRTLFLTCRLKEQLKKSANF